MGCYTWDDEQGSYIAHVLTLRGSQISAVTSFLDITRRGIETPGATSFVEGRVFERFGLPSELSA